MRAVGTTDSVNVKPTF